tara:strand:- start:120 stop:371 length:252 start_codon:yes stop_codon:yes gene_type:complete
MISSKQIEKHLGKKRMSLVEIIHDDDPEVIDVWLKEGLSQSNTSETMWVLGRHRLLQNGGYMTVKEMYSDLLNWFDEGIKREL